MGAYDRRSILIGGAAVASAATFTFCKDDGQGGATPQLPPDAGRGPKVADGEMSLAEVMPTLVAVADRILPPDETGPGVKELGMEQFLERNLDDPRLRPIVTVLKRGAVWLSRASRTEQSKNFYELGVDAQDAFLKRLANGEVRPTGFTPQAFMRIMLALCLEAYLGDPRYGGNKDGAGWKFIGGINWSGR